MILVIVSYIRINTARFLGYWCNVLGYRLNTVVFGYTAYFISSN